VLPLASRPSARIRGMELQFSLASIFISTAVAATVALTCVRFPVRETRDYGPFWANERNVVTNLIWTTERQPDAAESTLRMCWAIPIAIAATGTTLLMARRLRTRWAV